MLILTRRTSERIMIGDDITISIVSVRGNHVSIGIDCPRDIPVFREEVFEKIQREKERES